ncbi:MAG: DUF177 domain-containing protein [Clostridia bacterium]|nr:DUF177 domain-containing protein [Clostridia bacterium]
MIIDLKSIFVNDNASLPVDYLLDLSDTEYAGQYPLKKPVHLVGSVSNKASLVRLCAKIVFEYEAPCDRCGKPTVAAVKVEVDKVLATSIEGEDSDTILLVPDMKLQLDDFIYTETVVNLPMKHLCKADCKGVCSKCGKDLNEGECDCPQKEIDPRLAVLAQLLDN